MATVYGGARSAVACAVENDGDDRESQSSDTALSPAQKSIRARLTAFYWAHDPREVDHVDSQLAQYQGCEEELIQRVHREYGVRDFSGELAVDEIYEHERYAYMSLSWGSSMPGHLLPTDRRRWSTLKGTPSSQIKSQVEPQLPVNWHWTSEWHVDKSCPPQCDADGWSYAFDFPMLNSTTKRNNARPSPRVTDYVRRRRWIRLRARQLPHVQESEAIDRSLSDKSPEPVSSDGSDEDCHQEHIGEDEEDQNADGEQGEYDNPSSHRNMFDVPSALDVDDDEGDDPGDENEDVSGEEGGGGRNQDQNDDDGHEHPSPRRHVEDSTHDTSGREEMPQCKRIHQCDGYGGVGVRNNDTEEDTRHTDACGGRNDNDSNNDNALSTELKRFSLSMKKSEVDAAWSKLVKQLEHIYGCTKRQQKMRKKEWTTKKEKLRHQIQLLEKTIATMETMVHQGQDPLQRRHSSSTLRTEQPGQPTGTEARPLSPDVSTSQRRSRVGQGDTSGLNLANKLHCAQSKLDALRRQFWHPREKDYTLRISMDGIFYGLREFFIETVNGAFEIHMGHQTNGARGIAPTCRVSFQGHVTCCGKHVKVVGESGTLVPKSMWDRMYVDTDVTASVYLIYVEDVTVEQNPWLAGKPAGSWEFLLGPETTHVELSNFTRRTRGGMDLPAPVVRKLMQDVLTTLLRDVALSYLPPELALTFNAPPTKFDLVGEISLTGPPIDSILERDLDFLRDDRVHESERDTKKHHEPQRVRRGVVVATDSDAATGRVPPGIGDGSGSGESSVFDATNLLSPRAAAAGIASLFTVADAEKHLHEIATLLELSPAQLNLLVVLRQCALFASPHSFRSIAALCDYYRAYMAPLPGADQQASLEREEQAHVLCSLWQDLLELVYIRKHNAQASSSLSASTAKPTPLLALFDMTAFFARISALTRQPLRLALQVKRLHCTVNATRVVDAMSQLFERLVLGITYSKPRATRPDQFVYGFRFGRKPKVAASAARAAQTQSAQLLEPGVQLHMDSGFRSRLKVFSTLCRALKSAIALIKRNLDSVSVEIAGGVRGMGDDCQVRGSFREMEFVGPVNVSVLVPALFLGSYRIATVSLPGDRIGLQLDLLVPKPVSHKADMKRRNREDESVLSMAAPRMGPPMLRKKFDKRKKNPPPKPIRGEKRPWTANSKPVASSISASLFGTTGALGADLGDAVTGANMVLLRAIIVDLTMDVMMDMDAFMEQHRHRCVTSASGVTAPWSPSSSFAREVEMADMQTKHRAFGFAVRSSTKLSFEDGDDDMGDHTIRIPPSLAAATPGPPTYGKVRLTTSEFTKLHVCAKSGSFSAQIRLLFQVLLVHAGTFLRQSFPAHDALFDRLHGHFLKSLCASGMNMDFDILFKGFLHRASNNSEGAATNGGDDEQDKLFFTVCGTPGHEERPLQYQTTINALDLVLDVDDLINHWVDDRYPPYPNPLYF